MEIINSFAKLKLKEGSMKEFTIIFIILIIIIGGAIYTNNYLNNSSQKLVGMLEDLKQKVEQNSDNIEDLKTDVDNVYNEWESTEKKWAFIVLHSELDLIETSFTKMKAQIEEGEVNRSMEEIETSIFLVNHISEKEKFCLKNIL